MWFWCKNRQINIWNRTKCSEADPWLMGKLTYAKGGLTSQWKKNRLDELGKLAHYTEKIKLDPDWTLHPRRPNWGRWNSWTNSRERWTPEGLCDLKMGKHLFHRPSKAQTVKNQWSVCIKIKYLLNKLNRHFNGEDICNTSVHQRVNICTNIYQIFNRVHLQF